MKDKLFKDIEMKRLARRDAAREAGAAAPVGGRRGWRFAWRVLSLTLALSLLFNSVSFGIDGTTYRAARAAMEGLSLDGGDYGPVEGEAEIGGDAGYGHDAGLADKTYVYTFETEKTVLLSQIFAMYMLPVPMTDVETVMLLGGGDPADPTDLVQVEPLQDARQQIYDYRITALRSFDGVRLSVPIASTGDVYTLVLSSSLVTADGDAEVAEAEAFDLGGDDEPAEVGNATYAYSLDGASQARLGDIISACGMPIAAGNVEMVALAGGRDSADAPVLIEDLGGDYLITAQENFSDARLLVYTAQDTYALILTDGSGAEPDVLDVQDGDDVFLPEPAEEGVPEEVTLDLGDLDDETPEPDETPVEPDEEPADEPDEPGEEPADEPGEALTAEPVDEQTIATETEEELTTEPVEEQPVEEQVTEPIEGQTEEPVEEQVNEPVEELTTEPVEEQVTEPVEEQTTEPVDEQTTEPVEEQVTEPVEEQPTEPVEEQDNEPVEEQPTEPVEEQPTEPIDEQITEPVNEQTTEPVEEPSAYPAQSYAGGTAHVRVQVDAPEGAFPEGTTMEVAPNEDSEVLSGIADAVAEDFVEVKSIYAVDIAFLDAEGAEIEPLLPTAVVMSVDAITEAQRALIVHVNDAGVAEIVEQTAAPQTHGDALDLNMELSGAAQSGGQQPVAEQLIAEQPVAEPQVVEQPIVEPQVAEQTAAEPSVDTQYEAEPFDDAPDEILPEPVDDAVPETETDLSFEADAFSTYAVVIVETVATRRLDASGENWAVELDYGADAGIPADAALQVSEMTGAVAEVFTGQAARVLDVDVDSFTYVKVLDMAIVKDGEALQPQAPVSVSVQLHDIPERVTAEDDLRVVHFSAIPQALDCAVEGETVTFEADGFSAYVIAFRSERQYPAQSFEARAAGVSVSVDAQEGAFPEGTTMRVKRVMDNGTISDIREAVSEDFLAVKRVQLVDISFFDKDGLEIEPLVPVTVSMTVSGMKDEQEAMVVHVESTSAGDGSGSETNTSSENETTASGDISIVPSEVTEVDGGSMDVSFDADAFSMYAVVVTETIQTKYIDAEGNTWAVEVGYGADAGIPAGAELEVSELTGTKAQEYTASAAEALDVDVERVTYAKALDIIISKNGEEVQPQAPVKVSIRLLDAPEAEEDMDVNVLHFGDEVETVECAFEGDRVEFEADGFSVYVVVQLTGQSEIDLDGSEVVLYSLYGSNNKAALLAGQNTLNNPIRRNAINIDSYFGSDGTLITDNNNTLTVWKFEKVTGSSNNNEYYISCTNGYLLMERNNNDNAHLKLAGTSSDASVFKVTKNNNGLYRFVSTGKNGNIDYAINLKGNNPNYGFQGYKATAGSDTEWFYTAVPPTTWRITYQYRQASNDNGTPNDLPDDQTVSSDNGQYILKQPSSTSYTSDVVIDGEHYTFTYNFGGWRVGDQIYAPGRVITLPEDNTAPVIISAVWTSDVNLIVKEKWILGSEERTPEGASATLKVHQVRKALEPQGNNEWEEVPETDYLESIVFNAENGWGQLLSNLPSKDATYQYGYFVVEDSTITAPSGRNSVNYSYTPNTDNNDSFTYNGVSYPVLTDSSVVTVKNTYSTSSAIIVKKEWVDDAGTKLGDVTDKTVQVELYRLQDGSIDDNYNDWLAQTANLTPIGRFAISNDTNWQKTLYFAGDDANNTYFVKETSVTIGGVAISASDPNYIYNADTKTFTITNVDNSNYVCKITDKDHNILKISGGGTAKYETLESAFSDFASKSFTAKDGTPQATPKYIELLNNYDLQNNISVAGNVILRTASKTDPEFKGPAPGAVYSVGRGAATGSMFTVPSEATLQFENITIDGGATFTQNSSGVYEYTRGEVTADGGIVNVENGGSLSIVGASTTLQNTAVKAGTVGNKSYNGQGGAVYVADGGNLTVMGNDKDHKVNMKNCKSGSNGGAIYTEQKDPKNADDYWVSINISNASFSSCTGNSGGAVHIGKDLAKCDATSKFENCDFEHCYAKRDTDKYGGGAIRCMGRKLNLTSCTFTDCTSIRQGGAVFQMGDTKIDITGCYFTDCGAGVGSTKAASGALETEAKVININGSHFTNCASTRNAGAINFYRDNSVTDFSVSIINTTFTGCIVENKAEKTDEGNGGAIRVKSSQSAIIEIQDCKFSNCSAGRGGAIYCEGGTTKIDGETTISGCEATKIGGGICLNTAQSILELNNSKIKISNCSAPSGGGVYQGGGTCTLNGGTIGGDPETVNGVTKTSANKANNGGGVYMDDGTFNMNGGSVVSNAATQDGGGVYMVKGNFTMDSTTGIIQSNTATRDGGGVYLGSGTFTLKKGSLDNNSASHDGGGVYMAANGENTSFTLKDGSLVRNKANNGNGGGVYMKGGTFELQGGTVGGETSADGNTAKNGGGVYLLNGQFNLNGGTLQQCYAQSDGGGVYQGGGLFKYTSGTLSHCYAKQGGGIYIGGTANVLIAGNKAIVTNCETKKITFAEDGTVTVADYSGGSDAKQYLGGGVYQKNGIFALTSGAKVQNCKAYSGGGAYLEDGTFYLGGSFMLKSDGTIDTSPQQTGNNIYSGAGEVCSCEATQDGGGVYMKAGTFTMNNSGSTITGNKAAKGAGVYLSQPAGKTSTMNVLGGTIYSNVASSCGAGVYMDDGTFKLNGGTIGGDATKANLAASDGGGVYMLAGTFKLDNGIVSYNRAGVDNTGTANITGGNGGGIFLGGGGTFSFTKGTISYNEAEGGNLRSDGEYNNGKGGGVYHGGGSFSMSSEASMNGNKAIYGGGAYLDENTNGTILTLDGGSISYNTATLDGGGVYMSKLANSTSTDLERVKFTFNSGAMQNNTANRNGGGAYMQYGTFTLKNGGVIGGDAATWANVAKNGGGVYMANGNFSMSGTNSAVKYNSASVDGGGVYMKKGNFGLTGGNIAHNTATTSKGGGVYMEDGDFTLEGGSIDSNTAEIDGGGVYMANGQNIKFILRGGDVTRNTATAGNGGGVYMGGGTVEMKDGNIGGVNPSYGNTAQNGGGVYMLDGEFSLEGGNVAHNTATTGNGGGVYMLKETFTLEGGSVVSNTAPEGNGGGVYLGGGGFELKGGNIGGEEKTEGNTAKKGGGVFLGNATMTVQGGSVSNNEATVEGGGVYIGKDGSFTMSEGDGVNGTVANNISYSHGGGVYMVNGTFTMNGGNVVQNESGKKADNIPNTSNANGGGVYMENGTFTMNGGSVLKNKAVSATSMGGGVYMLGGTFTMQGEDEGGYVGGTTPDDGNLAASDGGGVYLGSGSTFILNNGNVAYNQAGSNTNGTGVSTSGGNGGGIYLGSGGTFTFNTGSVSHNMARGVDADSDGEYETGKGGGVYHGGGSFEMKTGAEMNNNDAIYGAGAYLADNGEYNTTLTLVGGSISSNTATLDGGGVYMDKDDKSNKDVTFTFTDGDMRSNTTSRNGGGIYMKGGTFTLDGKDATVGMSSYGNKAARDGGGVYMLAGTFNLNSGAVSYNEAGATIIGSTTNTTGGNGGGIYLGGGGTFSFASGSVSYNKANGIADPDNEGEFLNGKGGGVYHGGGSFGMTNSGATIAHNQAIYGAGAYLAESTNRNIRTMLTLSGGSISENEASLDGGGVYMNKLLNRDADDVAVRVSFSFTGGSMKKNSAARYGGGAYMKDGTFELNGGVVGGDIEDDGNTAAQDGGGVYMEGGSFSMQNTDSAIKYNAATRDGGGVYMVNGEFTMDNQTGTITYNEASRNGGGVYMGNGTFTLDNATATITHNTATYDGGGVYMGDGQFALNNGSIDSNTATNSNGGGVYMGNGIFTLASGRLVRNKAFSFGGGVYMDNGTFNMNGGAIGGDDSTFTNTAGTGGGVFMENGTFNMNSNTCLIKNNTASHNGGGVSMEKGEFYLNNGTIQECYAANNGGGVYLGGGLFKYTKGTLSYCYAKKGGGVYVGADANVLIVKNGEIKYCDTLEVTLSDGIATATLPSEGEEDYQGGGIYQGGGTLALTNGAQITNCEAYSGGGAYMFDGKFYLGGTVQLGEDGTITKLETNTTGENIYTGYGTVENCHAFIDGGGVYLQTGEFYLRNGTVQNNYAVNNGGGVNLGGGRFEYTAGTLKNCYAQKGGGVYVGSTGNPIVIITRLEDAITECDAKKVVITNRTASAGAPSTADGDTLTDYQGGGVYQGGGSLYLTNGASIEKCTAYNGGGVYMAAGNFNLGGSGTLNNGSSFTGAGTVKDCEAFIHGGGVAMGDKQNCTFTFTDGSVVRNKATNGNGGGVYMVNGTFNMNGGKIGDAPVDDGGTTTTYTNTATNGGGVYMAAGTFNMNESACGIIYNTATNDGGGVYLQTGEFYLRNGTVQNNYAVNNGGGVNLGGGRLEYTNGSLNNCYAKKGGGIYVGTDASTKVIITKSGEAIKNCDATKVAIAGGQASTSTPSTDAGDTLADYQGGGVYQGGGNLTLSNGASIENCTAYNGGGVYMAAGNFNLGGSGTLNNGSSFTGAGTVKDCEAFIHGGGVAMGDNQSCTFTFTDGSVVRNKATNGNGGGVYMGNGTFTMNGGKIGDAPVENDGTTTTYTNTARNGGGVYMVAGTFNMNEEDCAITYNTATIDGGGVNMQTGEFYLKNGTVQYNYATNNGGGVNLGGGRLEYTDGALSYCYAKKGGGIYVGNGSRTTVYITRPGDAIKYCDATKVAIAGGQASTSTPSTDAGDTLADYQGGGVYQGGGNLTLSNGASIENCTAYNGGGVYMAAGNFNLGGSGTLNNGSSFTGAGTVSDCRASIDGGGVYLKAGTLDFANGIVSKNTAQGLTSGDDKGGNGGGIYQGGGEFNLNSGTIGGDTSTDGNTANNGGGVYLANANMTANGGTVSHNTARVNGGGLYLGDGGVLSFTQNTNNTSVSVDNNTSTFDGGGVYMKNGQFTFSGGSVASNHAGNANNTGNGGGVCLLGGTLVLDGGKVGYQDAQNVAHGNTATGNGGGVYLGNATFTLNTGSIGNNASNGKGGGVYQANGTLSMTPKDASATIGGSVEHNTSYSAGGGVYLGGGRYDFSIGSVSDNQAGVRIDGITLNTADDYANDDGSSGYGGGVYLGGGQFQLSDQGSITSNTAVRGGGIFLKNGTSGNEAELNMSGGEIYSNFATTAGGGVAVGGEFVRLKFSGEAKVGYADKSNANEIEKYKDDKQNWMKVDTDNIGQYTYAKQRNDGNYYVPCNVYLNQDTVQIIHADNDKLTDNAYIGIYASDDEEIPVMENKDNDIYHKHGIHFSPFGTYNPEVYGPQGSAAETDNDWKGLEYYHNDINGMYGGAQFSDNEHLLVWLRIIPLEVRKELIDKYGNKKCPLFLIADYKLYDAYETEEGQTGEDGAPANDDTKYRCFNGSKWLKIEKENDTIKVNMTSEEVSTKIYLPAGVDITLSETMIDDSMMIGDDGSSGNVYMDAARAVGEKDALDFYTTQYEPVDDKTGNKTRDQIKNWEVPAGTNHTVRFIIKQEADDPIIKVINTRKTAPVTINKELIDPLPGDVTFGFEAYVWDYGDRVRVADIIDTEGNVKEKNGDHVPDDFTIETKKDSSNKKTGSKIIPGLPYGATLVVTEKPDAKDAFTTKVGDKETKVASVLIYDTKRVANNTATFTNTRKKADVRITKVLVDPYDKGEQTFTFDAKVSYGDTDITDTYNVNGYGYNPERYEGVTIQCTPGVISSETLVGVPVGAKLVIKERQDYKKYDVQVGDEIERVRSTVATIEEVITSSSSNANVNNAATFTNTRMAFKLTDKDGNLLYVDVDGKKLPAVYADLTSDVLSAADNLSKEGKFYTKGTENNYTKYSGSYQVKQLVPSYTLGSGLVLSANEAATLTTADNEDTMYPYTGTSGTYGTITRGNDNTASMIKLKDKDNSLTLKNITLDGGKATVSVDVNGGIVNVAKGTLIIDEGAVLCNAKTSGKGGAVYVSDGASMQMKSGSITRNEAGSGSAVFVATGTDGGSAAFSGGSVTENTVSDTCGAVQVDAQEGATKATLSFKGAPTIYDNKYTDGDNDQQKNVVLDIDSNAVIKAMDDAGLTGGKIGVYVTGRDVTGSEEANPWKDHGGALDPFGTWKDENDTTTELKERGTHYFINDVNGMTGAARSDGKLVWMKLANLTLTKELVDKYTNQDRTFHFDVWFGDKAEDKATGKPYSYAWSDGTTDYKDILEEGEPQKKEIEIKASEITDGTCTKNLAVVKVPVATPITVVEKIGSSDGATNAGLSDEVDFYTTSYAAYDPKGSDSSRTKSEEQIKEDGEDITYTHAFRFTVDENVTAPDPYVKVTNTRKTADVVVTKELSDDFLLENATQAFNYKAELKEYNGEDKNYYTLTNYDDNATLTVSDTGLDKISETKSEEGEKPRFIDGVYYVVSGDTESTSDPFSISAKHRGTDETKYAENYGTFTLKDMPVGASVVITEDGNIRYSTAVDDVEIAKVKPDDPTEAVVYVKAVKPIGAAVKFTNTRKITVSFRKVDSYGEPLEGAKFALYSTPACTEDVYIEPNFPAKDDYPTPDGLSLTAKAVDPDTGDVLKKGDVQFKFLSGGLYYMKETYQPEGFRENPYTYAVLVGRKGVTEARAEGGPLYNTELANEAVEIVTDDRPFAIYRLDEAGKADTSLDVERFGIMNIKTGSRRVNLRKASGSTETGITGLIGAHFRIFRIDLTEVTEGQPVDISTENPKGYYESGASGVYFTGMLPYGKYYLVETKAPNDPDYSDNLGKMFVLTVEEATAETTVDNTSVTRLTLTAEEDTEDKIVEVFKNHIAAIDEETPDEETPGGETPGGETPGGETPGGETPGGETPDGETSGSGTSPEP